MRKPRGERILNILERIGGIALSTAELINLMLSSSGRNTKRLWQGYYESERTRNSKGLKEREYHEWCDLICRLRRQGIIEKEESKWKLTIRGKDKLKTFKKLKGKFLPVRSYEKTEDDEFKLIIFDIPESDRRKRGWLRDSLVNLGFNMLQKSVWGGKVKIPENF